MGLSKAEESRIRERIEGVTSLNSSIRDRHDRTTSIIYGAVGLFYLVLIVYGLVNGIPAVALSTLGLLVWAVFAWLQALTISQLQCIVDTQHGLREIEHEELLGKLAEAEAKAKKK